MPQIRHPKTGRVVFEHEMLQDVAKRAHAIANRFQRPVPIYLKGGTLPEWLADGSRLDHIAQDDNAIEIDLTDEGPRAWKMPDWRDLRGTKHSDRGSIG
jgi:hypothetical protein